MNYPLQNLMQLGVLPAGQLSDRQPVLRLRTLTVHSAERARSSRIWRGVSCPSRARPIMPRSPTTPSSRAIGWT